MKETEKKVAAIFNAPSRDVANHWADLVSQSSTVPVTCDRVGIFRLLYVGGKDEALALSKTIWSLESNLKDLGGSLTANLATVQ